jgi:very-short-patch-repair endonuclease
MKEEWMRARSLRNSATDPERHLWRYLRRENLAGYKFRRQFPIGAYIVDFVCVRARLVIELDGGHHASTSEYDARRTLAIKACGYRVLRFWNDDVVLRTDLVLEQILRNLGNR